MKNLWPYWSRRKTDKRLIILSRTRESPPLQNNNVRDTKYKSLVKSAMCYVDTLVIDTYIGTELYFKTLSQAGKMAHTAPTEDLSLIPNSYIGLFTTALTLAPRRSDALGFLRYQ